MASESSQIENVARQFSSTALDVAEEETSRLSDVRMTFEEGDTDTGGAVASTATSSTHAYSMYSNNTHPLNTLVDMALALELGARPTSNVKSSKPDHTYSMTSKKQAMRCHFLGQVVKDTDNVSSEKDHTYASNTIGFRYSSHRGKSASEESLLQKSAQNTAVRDTSARKCTSAETFNFPDLPPPESSPPHTTSGVQTSNSATLPRSKSKPREASNDCGALEQPCKTTPKPTTSKSTLPLNLDLEAVDSLSKSDHTYARYGDTGGIRDVQDEDFSEKNSDSEDCADANLISTSAPGKIELIGLEDSEQNIRFAGTDHTYDKLSSAKNTELPTIQHKNNEPLLSPTIVKSGTSNLEISAGSVSPCVSAMDWQPLEYIQTFEKHFLPSDHTYTTVV